MAGLLPLLRRGIEQLGYDPPMFAPVRMARRTFRAIGLDVEPFGPRSMPWQLRRLFRSRMIDTLVDIGANRGQFALAMRDLGFGGTIHSFEPVPEVFATLKATAARDQGWQVHPLALAAAPGRATFHVGRYDQTSSLKPLAPGESDAHEVLKVARQIEVEVDTLDAFVKTSGIDPRTSLLKIDVQGAEFDVLDGAAGTLPLTRAVICETAFEKSYVGEADFGALVERLLALGFRLNGIAPVYFHPRRLSIMQVDVLFVRPWASHPA